MAVLALLISGLLDAFVVDNAKNKQIYQRQITDRVRSELANVQGQLEFVTQASMHSKVFFFFF
jgi:hypothetical protein